MGTNSLPIDHRMKYQIVLLAVTLALLVTEAQAKKNKKDVRCKNRRGSVTEKTITLNAKETLKFETRGKSTTQSSPAWGSICWGPASKLPLAAPSSRSAITTALMTVTTMVMMMAMMITMMMMTVEMRRKSAIVVSPLARRESLVVRRQKFRNTHGR